MEIHSVEIEPLQVIGLTHTGSYTAIGQKFEQLSKLQGESELKSAPLVAIYYDDPHQVPEENLRSFAGVIVHQGNEHNDSAMQQASIPGGKYAMASYTEPYSGLPKAWEDFYGSIFGSGLKTKADLCFERYINTPADVQPSELITELYAPLA